MPPKRKRNVTLTSKGLPPGESLKRHTLPNNSPWFWVDEEVTDPSDITPDHLLTACGLSSRNSHPFCPNKYASDIPRRVLAEVDHSGSSSANLEDDVIVISDDGEPVICNKKQCRTNPNCLNYLGQDMWEDGASAEEAVLRAADLGRNPMLESKDEHIPVGLKNLGATCYANASLQVWFRDLAFRSGVYSCEPTEGIEGKFEESPIFQLQVTFAALQKGSQKVYNPTRFVESLKLRTSEQQDAQEFSKLFMSHLDSEFRKQSLPAVRSLVTDQFQGQQCYLTICDGCGYCSARNNDFLEIEINFENNSALEERIAASLLPERLMGDNKYFCPKCDSLQDATRQVELSHLPPVLHISLLRFVYDISTMERKKSKYTLSFPETLNMGQFLGTNAQEKNLVTSDQYELRGILLHKGTSAYHGHYEAQIYDATTQSWFQFNDDIVTKVKNLGGEKCTQNNDEAPSRTDRNPRKRRKTEETGDKDRAESRVKQPAIDGKRYTSKDAYMLIYSRKESVTEEPVPPQKALDVVNDFNINHEMACKSFLSREISIKHKANDMRRKLMEIYSNWNVASHSEESVIVSYTALNLWLSKNCIDVALRESNNQEERRVLNDDISCEHELLDPGKARDMKRISQRAYDTIRRETSCLFEPALAPSQVCRQCVETEFKERLYQIRHPIIVKQFDEFCRSDSENLQGYWVSKKWLKDWRLQKPKMHALSLDDPPPDSDNFTGDVVCEHGGLTPAESERKKIPQRAAGLLQELFPLWQPIASHELVCDTCNETSHISQDIRKELRKRAEDEKAKLKRLHNSLSFQVVMDFDPAPAAVLSADFARLWKKWLDRPTVHDRPEAIDNSQFICEHGQLVFDPNLTTDIDSSMVIITRVDWDALAALYPAEPLVSLEPTIQENSRVRYIHSIPVCSDCRMRRKTEWETTEITVHFGRNHEEGSNHKLLVVHSQKMPGARQSKRLRQLKEYGKRRKITVSKSTTVMDIKRKINEDLHIPTILQRLICQDHELSDNTAIVASLGILANDVVQVQEDNEIVEIGSDPESDSGMKRRREEGAGFGGTLLGGTGEFSSSSGNTTPHPENDGKNCPACTFCNAYDAQTCTICDTFLI